MNDERKRQLREFLAPFIKAVDDDVEEFDIHKPVDFTKGLASIFKKFATELTALPPEESDFILNELRVKKNPRYWPDLADVLADYLNTVRAQESKKPEPPFSN